ncbi:hypothetical protein Btru_049189 [Bulinus truncatus]|nr:hypothetical protein Btru_049189 [Bulinus truncatus]
MSGKYQNFQSQFELDARKEENKKARQLILDQARKKFERDEAKKEKAKKSGEGTWMLDSVSQRIHSESESFKKKAKKKKSKKKHKRHSSSSESDREHNADEAWVEVSKKVDTGVPTIKGPKIQRESWMEAPLDILPTTSRQELRDIIKKQKDEANKEAERLLQPGQHTRELNPYWKDGGSGLPENEPDKKTKSSTSLPQSSTGDGGLAWLRQSYIRCKQQAVDEGRNLEEVVAERWGSLKKLESMLAEAEKKHKNESRGSRTRDDRYKHRDYQKGSKHKDDYGHQEHTADKRLDDRKSYEKREKHRDESGERRSHYQRPRSEEEDDQFQRTRNVSDFSRDSKKDKTVTSSRRPDSDSEDERGTHSSQINSVKNGKHVSESPRDSKKDKMAPTSRFQRPGSDSEDERDTRLSRNNSVHKQARETTEYRKSKDDRQLRRSPEITSRWKKSVPGEAEDKEKSKSRDSPEKEKSKEVNRRRKSSSSSCDSSSDSDEESPEPQTQKDEVVNVPSEQELNDMAAKILRAEIMGNDALAAELKDKLEKARRLREDSKANGNDNTKDFSHSRKDRLQARKRQGGENKETDNVVVLSRTSKSGLVRPVAGTTDPWGTGASKKRKKNAQTHDVVGQRTIYFDDDDKLDLKSLVEQEKAGTAEDQNSMFARLAGKSHDRDLDVDDMFVSKAARKQDAEKSASRDRSAAIFEHRKVSSAVEKCNRCLQKVPKHLIIALGTKSYLSLPHHRSLTEGHCLIVPMQHVQSGTTMDEDVWKEMQMFRKSLVQMFREQDQDVVVMETVMHLKHFPHTALECVPLEREKAIQEVGPEWSDNKKLHSLKGKDVRSVIPKGFPYFSVDFGLDGGYATVIEDEAKFPAYFGREIVGGMLDAEPTLWRHPHKQSFEDQRQKVLKFEQMWKPFDWTQNLTSAD